MSRAESSLSRVFGLSYRGDQRWDFLQPLARTRSTPSYLTLIGPLPIVAMSQNRIPRHIGWRALILHRNATFAMVDCIHTNANRSISVIYGAGVATTFLHVLVAARRQGLPPKRLCVIQSGRPRATCLACHRDNAPTIAYPLVNKQGRMPHHVRLTHWHYKSRRVRRSRPVAALPTTGRN